MKNVFEKSKLIYVFYASFQLIVYTITVTPFVLGMVTKTEDIKAQFLSENPDMAELVNDTIICFTNSKNSNLTGLYLMAVNILGFLFLTSLAIILYVYIKTNRNGSMSKSTQRVQLMLFRAFSIQVFNAFLFLLFPMCSVGLMMYLRTPNTGKICSILLAIMSTHSLADYITMLVFITPYRYVSV